MMLPNGTAAAPLKTLEKAKNAARKARKEALGKSVTVILMPGIYPRTSPFDLRPEDSGHNDAPTVYRAQKPGSILLHGSRSYHFADLAVVKDPEILKRLSTAARGEVRRLSLKGLLHTGPFPDVFSDHGGLLEVFYDGKRLPLSRWPDGKAMTTMGSRASSRFPSLR